MAGVPGGVEPNLVSKAPGGKPVAGLFCARGKTPSSNLTFCEVWTAVTGFTAPAPPCGGVYGVRCARVPTPSTRLLSELVDVILVAEQKIAADDAMIEAIRAKPIVDEPDLARTPMQY